MAHILYKVLQYCFPRAVQQFQHEVHQFYRDLGVQLVARVPRLELDVQPLLEGEIPQTAPQLRCLYQASIDQSTPIDIWQYTPKLSTYE